MNKIFIGGIRDGQVEPVEHYRVGDIIRVSVIAPILSEDYDFIYVDYACSEKNSDGDLIFKETEYSKAYTAGFLRATALIHRNWDVLDREHLMKIGKALIPKEKI